MKLSSPDPRGRYPNKFRGRSARGARNKKRTVSAAQTARFNLPTSACNGVSAIVRVRRKERPSPPRPSPQSGRYFFRIPGEPRSPASAGGGQAIPATQAPRSRRETPVSRPARAVPEQVPRGDPRAVREIKNERFQLHKPPVSTYPFPLMSAFSKSSASDEKSDLPRPDLPTQSGRYFFRIPGEPRSPDRAGDEAMKFRETSNAPPP